ncbi:phosphorylase [Chitinophagaceae bacterium IBVUCB1]|nr:phosphorylase [Chitinophagaceae bacterium IBVUCB1]
MNLPQHTLGASELIINKSGAIYHLNLKPKQIADTVLLVGDPARVAQVSKHFDKIVYKTQHREFITHTGTIGKRNISVISTGIGTDNIDIVMNELDALVNIDFKIRSEKQQTTSLRVIRLGTCGALQPDVPVDSHIVSSYAIGLDNLMHYYKLPNNADEQFILHEFGLHTRLQNTHITPYIAEASIQLRKHFGSNFLHGITITTPGFYGPQARALRIPISQPNLIDALATFNSRNMHILNFEMETSALYGLGKVMNHHCLSVSTVINNRATKTFSTNMQAAVDNMIINVLQAIA